MHSENTMLQIMLIWPNIHSKDRTNDVSPQLNFIRCRTGFGSWAHGLKGQGKAKCPKQMAKKRVVLSLTIIVV